MKRLLFLVAALVIGLSVTTVAAPPVAAGPAGPANWPALLNCADVDANGSVSIGDVMLVVSKFGTHAVQDDDGKFVPGPGYMLLYDLDGGGAVSIGDISTVVVHFGRSCPLIETQVAAATLAMAGLPPFDSNPDLRNWSEAEADGWEQTTEYVPAMGIHVQSLQGLTQDFNHLTPVGLVYTATAPNPFAPGVPDVPDDLIGAYFVVPIPEVCAEFANDPNSGIFGIDPQDCSSTIPEGFDGVLDNNPAQGGPGGPFATWHDHTGLCTGNIGTNDARVAETGSQSEASEDACLDGTLFPCGASGCFWFDTYGFMMHLYNFIPNPNGRFQMWNTGGNIH